MRSLTDRGTMLSRGPVARGLSMGNRSLSASDPDAIDNARFDEEVRAYMRANRGVSLREARQAVARRDMPRPEPSPSAPPPSPEGFLEKGRRIAKERGIPLSQAFAELSETEPELHREFLDNAAAEQQLKRIERRLDSRAALRNYQPELASKIDQAEALTKQTAGLSRDERAGINAMELNARQARRGISW
ncbi:MAG: hypothetical protein AMXMBFR13_36440 [Phycisphaerae bacterium]